MAENSNRREYVVWSKDREITVYVDLNQWPNLIIEGAYDFQKMEEVKPQDIRYGSITVVYQRALADVAAMGGQVIPRYETRFERKPEGILARFFARFFK